MSGKKVNISHKVMEQIRSGKVSMKPRIYFMLGSLILFASLVASVVTSVFLINLTLFSLRVHGPMGRLRLDQMIDSFPWWAPFLAVGGIIFGIWLTKKYDFSYKIGMRWIVLGLILVIILSAFIINFFKWDDVWFRSKPMRGMMHRYWQNSREFKEYPGKKINRQMNRIPYKFNSY